MRIVHSSWCIFGRCCVSLVLDTTRAYPLAPGQRLKIAPVLVLAACSDSQVPVDTAGASASQLP